MFRGGTVFILQGGVPEIVLGLRSGRFGSRHLSLEGDSLSRGPSVGT